MNDLQEHTSDLPNMFGNGNGTEMQDHLIYFACESHGAKLTHHLLNDDAQIILTQMVQTYFLGPSGQIQRLS